MTNAATDFDTFTIKSQYCPKKNNLDYFESFLRWRFAHICSNANIF